MTVEPVPASIVATVDQIRAQLRLLVAHARRHRRDCHARIGVHACPGERAWRAIQNSDRGDLVELLAVAVVELAATDPAPSTSEERTPQ